MPRTFFTFLAPLPDTYVKKCPLVSMGVWAKGLACADPGARAPIGASENIRFVARQRIVLIKRISSHLALGIVKLIGEKKKA
jgi:hypothetical protein